MDKRKILLLVAMVIFLLGSLVTYMYFDITTSIKENAELEWYAKNLDYKFCGVVEQIEAPPQRWGMGFLWCRIVGSTNVSTAKEDSLQSHLKANKYIRLIMENRDGMIKLYQGRIDEFMVGDSICFDSTEGSTYWYREGMLEERSNIVSDLFFPRYELVNSK